MRLTVLARERLIDIRWKALAVEDVVPQDQGGAVRADELAADEEGLGEALRRWLNGVLDRDAELRLPSPSTPSKPPMSVGVEIKEDVTQAR